MECKKLENGMPVVTTKVIDIRDIQVETKDRRAISLNIGGDQVRSTKRFFNSMLTHYGMSNSIFNFFTHVEVFDRIADREKGNKLCLTMQENVDNSLTALAVSRPGKTIINTQALHNVFSDLGSCYPEKIEYISNSGVIRSTHSPSILGKSPIEIGGDKIDRKFVMDTPIDGYGSPSTFLMMLRQICQNGAVAEAPAFRHTFNIGNVKNNEAIPVLRNFITSLNDEEGFSAYTERLRTASNTPASLDEACRLHTILTKIYLTTNERTGVLTSFYNTVGADMWTELGVVTMEQIHAKKRRVINAKCSVMDIINFASEVGTHYAADSSKRRFDGFIGTMISNEYDLEGLTNKVDKKQDYYINN